MNSSDVKGTIEEFGLEGEEAEQFRALVAMYLGSQAHSAAAMLPDAGPHERAWFRGKALECSGRMSTFLEQASNDVRAAFEAYIGER